MKKIKLIVAALLASTLGLAACGDDKKPEPSPDPGPVVVDPAVTKVTVSGTNLIAVGQSVKLSVTVKTEGTASKEVTWSSSNDAIATVDQNGNVKGVSAGRITIRATSTFDNTKFGELTVTVETPGVKSIEIKNAPASIGLNETITLSANVTVLGDVAKTVTWSVDKEEIATINAETGALTSKSVGDVNVTATSTADFTKKATVKISVVKVSNVVLDFSKLNSVSGTVNGVTYTSSQKDGASAPVVNGTSHDLRLYAKNTLVVSANSNIQEIKFAISSQGLKRQANIACSTGTITYNLSSSEVKWTGNANSVTFTVGEKADYGTESSKAGQFCFTSMTVSFEGGGQESEYTPDGVLLDIFSETFDFDDPIEEEDYWFDSEKDAWFGYVDVDGDDYEDALLTRLETLPEYLVVEDYGTDTDEDGDFGYAYIYTDDEYVLGVIYDWYDSDDKCITFQVVTYVNPDWSGGGGGTITGDWSEDGKALMLEYLGVVLPYMGDGFEEPYYDEEYGVCIDLAEEGTYDFDAIVAAYEAAGYEVADNEMGGFTAVKSVEGALIKVEFTDFFGYVYATANKVAVKSEWPTDELDELFDAYMDFEKEEIPAAEGTAFYLEPSYYGYQVTVTGSASAYGEKLVAAGWLKDTDYLEEDGYTAYYSPKETLEIDIYDNGESFVADICSLLPTLNEYPAKYVNDYVTSIDETVSVLELTGAKAYYFNPNSGFYDEEYNFYEGAELEAMGYTKEDPTAFKGYYDALLEAGFVGDYTVDEEDGVCRFKVSKGKVSISGSFEEDYYGCINLVIYDNTQEPTPFSL